MGYVGPVLSEITLVLQLSFDKLPCLSDLALKAFGNIGDTVPQNLEVGLRSCDTLRDRHYIGGDARGRPERAPRHLPKEPLAWHYVRWDPDHERLRADPGREPVPHARVAAIVGSMQRLVAADVVTRFHPSREITKQMGGKNLTMSLQTSIHGEAAAGIRQHLQTLSGLSGTQLLGMRVRQDRPGRSALANLIQRHING